ncbi:response regulator transcription factor [Streptomyces sp. NPDC037389]|uniref:response regulator transcription factor n=1 Tax=Streptomyces sp. NPDC037389 TaxID=3155369 RepID=UPI0033CF403D
MIKILIVDDEPLIRSAFGAILGAEPGLEVVGEAGSGAEAVTLARSLSPDVILMDVRMPVLDGIRTTRRILEGPDPTPRIVVVTTFENDDYIHDALNAGACGFLLKRARPAEIVQAVGVAAVGDPLMFPAAVRDLARRRHGSDVVPARPGHPAADAATQPLPHGLTRREQDVLRLIASGLSDTEIAEQLVLGAETVKAHVDTVLSKLRARDRIQAVITAYESGFVVRGHTCRR